MYGFEIQTLLPFIRQVAPEKARLLARERSLVQHGLLSIGLKLHATAPSAGFNRLIERLGGRIEVLEHNKYKKQDAEWCLVFPPVGNVRAAETLVESLEVLTEERIFDSDTMQLQVNSPGRLTAERAAMLGIMFYLGSDLLRNYSLADFETTFSKNPVYPRAQRMLLFDAESSGYFDPNYDWWARRGDFLKIQPQLPQELYQRRTDLIVGSQGKRSDLYNINLIATLLVHDQYNGYWKRLGESFARDVRALLTEHLLSGLLSAPWIRTDDPKTNNDQLFNAALQELIAYAHQEADRIQSRNKILSWRRDAARKSDGILEQVDTMLHNYRSQLVRHSIAAKQGGTD